MDLIFNNDDDEEIRISLEDMYQMFRARLIKEIYITDRRIRRSNEISETEGERYWYVSEDRSLGVH